MKIQIFWDTTPCRWMNTAQLFGGACYLHLQGNPRTISITFITSNLTYAMVTDRNGKVNSGAEICDGFACVYMLWFTKDSCM